MRGKYKRFSRKTVLEKPNKNAYVSNKWKKNNNKKRNITNNGYFLAVLFAIYGDCWTWVAIVRKKNNQQHLSTIDWTPPSSQKSENKLSKINKTTNTKQTIMNHQQPAPLLPPTNTATAANAIFGDAPPDAAIITYTPTFFQSQLPAVLGKVVKTIHTTSKDQQRT